MIIISSNTKLPIGSHAHHGRPIINLLPILSMRELLLNMTNLAVPSTYFLTPPPRILCTQRMGVTLRYYFLVLFDIPVNKCFWPVSTIMYTPARRTVQHQVIDANSRPVYQRRRPVCDLTHAICLIDVI